VNPAVEQILLNFVKSELTKNPQLAGNFLNHVLQQAKVDPNIAAGLVEVLDELLPIILGAIK
jgi:hypothetical protein